jgi:predicted ATPase
MGWHVITAGPSAGKSSVIRELSARGYRTAPEAARLVTDQAISEGEDASEYRRSDAFQDDVIDANLRIERNLPTDTDVFLDRSLADNIAFCRLYDRSIPDNLFTKCRGRYDTVFLLERIEYQDDYARIEDASESQQIHEELRSVYEDLGYRVIEVELDDVRSRARYIQMCVRGGPPI